MTLRELSPQIPSLVISMTYFTNCVFHLDHKALRFLHDHRMPVFSDSDESRGILEKILGDVIFACSRK